MSQSKIIFTNVLLVEDDPSHAAIIQRNFRSFVANTNLVSSFRGAIESLSKIVPEVIICDLHLPDLSGFEIVKNLHLQLPETPIIVLTSSNDLEQAVEAMRAGAWDYMTKQFGENMVARFELVFARIRLRLDEELRAKRLQAERDAYAEAVSNANDGLGIINRAGEIVFQNHSFEDFIRNFSGNSPSVIDLLLSFDKRIGAEFSEQLNNKSEKLFWSSEIIFPNKTSFELILSSLSNNNFVLFVRDITTRKAEQEFQRDLLSTTTHDLKGPLGAIINSAELLHEMLSEIPEKSRELLTRIESCSRNCITLIDELLSARRIQDGVLVVNPQWIGANEVIDDISLDYLAVAKSKSINLKQNQNPTEPKVYADPLALRRVLGNIINNALKFTPKEGKVEVSIERGETETRFIIEDSGPGIGARDRGKLFEKYERLDRDNNIDGTGLGLFVVKNIVSAHGGRVELKSDLGKGTTFTLVFPDPES
jgi:two-component system sensor histidine kinase ResE